MLRCIVYGLWCLAVAAVVWSFVVGCVHAQQPDPAKLSAVYQLQRNAAADAQAACVASANDLQLRINDLERQFEAATGKKPESAAPRRFGTPKIGEQPDEEKPSQPNP